MSFPAIAALDPSSKHRKIKAFLRFSAGASALLSRKNPIIQSFHRHLLLSGVLIPAVIAWVGTPLFVYGAESPIAGESRDAITDQPPDEPDRGGYEPSGINVQYRMQLLQREVMVLRGQVEQLQHVIDRQKSIQDDRYLELDARLQQFMQTMQTRTLPISPVPASLSEGRTPEGETFEGETAETMEGVDDELLSEQELFENTKSLIRSFQFDLAIPQLESLITRFPDGDNTANYYYWLGQVYAGNRTNPDFEKARQAFAQVIGYFPEHSRVPEATYHLGRVYHTLGDCERAADLLQQVVDEYPDKSVANLAENYLRESVNCLP